VGGCGCGNWTDACRSRGGYGLDGDGSLAARFDVLAHRAGGDEARDADDQPDQRADGECRARGQEASTEKSQVRAVRSRPDKQSDEDEARGEQQRGYHRQDYGSGRS